MSDRRDLAERILLRMMEPYSFAAAEPDSRAALMERLAADAVGLADALIKRADEAWGPFVTTPEK